MLFYLSCKMCILLRDSGARIACYSKGVRGYLATTAVRKSKEKPFFSIVEWSFCFSCKGTSLQVLGFILKCIPGPQNSLGGAFALFAHAVLSGVRQRCPDLEHCWQVLGWYQSFLLCCSEEVNFLCLHMLLICISELHFQSWNEEKEC